MTGVLRRLGEWLSRGVVLKRKLPGRFGRRPLLVTPDSRLAYWRRNLERVEPELLAWADEFISEGDTVWDLGANVGVFSLAAAVRAGPGGHVLALEPDLRLARLLQRSVDLSSSAEEAEITVLPLAAGSSAELARLRIADRGRSSNYLDRFGGGTQTGGTRKSYRVMSITLDWLAGRVASPDLVKIDVEGAEGAVLEGGRAVLRDHRPILLIEVYERNQGDVAKVLRETNYRFYDATAQDGVERKPVPNPVKETLCLPEEADLDPVESDEAVP